MKLNQIYIKNFRSIKDLVFDFNPKLRIFIGKNEAGKSNLLRALSLLSNSVKIEKEDLREPLPDEDEIVDSFIKFIFLFDVKDHEMFLTNIKDLIYTKSINVKIVKKGSKEYSIKEVLGERASGVYEVDTKARKKVSKYYLFEKEYSVLSNWKKLKINVQSPFGEKHRIFNGEEIPVEFLEHFEDLTMKDFQELIGTVICNYIDSSIPKVIVWRFDESNLLPSVIDIDAFINNPNTVIPLKNMFNLAGIDDIKAKLTEAKSGSSNKLINLLNRVSDKATKHFREVWREYKSIKFSLVPNGNTIVPSIEEHNRFLFSQRSDGFKRFVTFLLLISVNNRSNSLNNCLIIMDEPDMGLHPSGIRYLKEELIKISKNNLIAISTHSIFMIDSEDISRHLIVSKEREQTSVTVPNIDNIVDEEVIFTAVGHSVYDFLKQTNILFEGWRDKKLFRTAIASWPEEYKELEDFFKVIGSSHSQGVNQIKNVVPIFELANRECFIISDDDLPAKNKQKEFIKEKCYGTWLRYSEIEELPNVITGEDFVEIELMKRAVKSILSKDERLKNEPNLANGNTISSIKTWIKTCGITDAKIEETLVSGIKDFIFENLETKSIKPVYYRFLKKFSEIADKKLNGERTAKK